MKITTTIILAFLISTKVYGTIQIPDILIYKNDTIDINTYPLESFYSKENQKAYNYGIPKNVCSGCWRGYQSTWEIIDNNLYLIEIKECCHLSKYLITDSVIFSLKDKVKPKKLQKIESLKGTTYHIFNFQKTLKSKLGFFGYRKYKQFIYNASRIPIQKTNLEKLFGNHYNDGKVLAFWFTGDIKILMGYFEKYINEDNTVYYKKELILRFENGKLIDNKIK